MPEIEEAGNAVEKTLSKRYGPFSVWEYVALASVGIFGYKYLKNRNGQVVYTGAVGAPVDPSSVGADSGIAPVSSSTPVPSTTGSDATPVTPPVAQPPQVQPPLIPGVFQGGESYGGGGTSSPSTGTVFNAVQGRQQSNLDTTQQFLQAMAEPRPTELPPVIPLSQPQPSQPLYNGNSADIIQSLMQSVYQPAPGPTVVYNPSEGYGSAAVFPTGTPEPYGVGNQSTYNNEQAQAQFDANQQYQAGAAAYDEGPAMGLYVGSPTFQPTRKQQLANQDIAAASGVSFPGS